MPRKFISLCISDRLASYYTVQPCLKSTVVTFFSLKIVLKLDSFLRLFSFGKEKRSCNSHFVFAFLRVEPGTVHLGKGKVRINIGNNSYFIYS